MAFVPFSGGRLAAQVALEQPKDEAILLVTGKIGATNTSDGAAFDRNMLEALGSATITTTTPWHTGTIRFDGVPMSKLMEAVAAQGKTLRVLALNDYVVTVPIKEFVDKEAILALKRDGQYMAIRDKGPLFIVFPYDDSPELQSQIYYSWSVWQVKRMDILP